MTTGTARAIGALVLLSAMSACVTTGTFDKKVAELEKERGDDDRAAAEREKNLKAEVHDLQAKLKEDEDAITRLTAERNDLREAPRRHHRAGR